ncbi:conserved hypothetical protein [Lodderomyces elongisporus NRRL YB-4239]|uniref:Uncharacterized protein n=2 Tax=Lodderomyces elongisporus TaxID=36914 RepID=A5DV05_LODEL|nr:conserved hypothetical protein [Lodderomyces elongisporus NRRL YB-4239]
MSNIQDQLENIPGYGIAMDYFNDYAEEHWNSKDPYYDEKTGKRLQLPPDITTKEEQKAWKSIQSKAWVHDKCLCGSCGVGMDCGVGLVPFVVLFFPVLGPLVMYALHSRIIEMAQKQFHIPQKEIAKMQSNIGIDLLITFPPVIGSFFGWLHGCSSRNAGLIYGCVLKMAKERAANGGGAKYIGRGTAGTAGGAGTQYFGDSQQQHVRNAQYSNPSHSRTNQHHHQQQQQQQQHSRQQYPYYQQQQPQTRPQPQQQSGFL